MEKDKKIKIFIAEDEPVLNEIYSQRFDMSGFAVKSFKNGMELVSALADDTPDIVLLDINMPDMNGYDVLNALHQNFQEEKKKNVLVIAWSNINTEVEIQKIKMSGASVFLNKSDYQGQDLVEKVRTIYLDKR
jgi:CheY-like chemotaxis protein